jgi:transcriptional antiterminator NusG
VNCSWYVLKVISGKEYSLKLEIEEKIKKANYSKYVNQVYCPLSINSDFDKKKAYFGGYIFLEVFMLPNYLVSFLKKIKGIFGFITEKSWGWNDDPLEMNAEDLKTLFNVNVFNENFVDDSVASQIIQGDWIKIIGGPFKDLEGKVLRINHNKKRLCIIGVFNSMSTPIELCFSQVKKIK